MHDMVNLSILRSNHGWVFFISIFCAIYGPCFQFS
uniref:Uncharacterized protein n=1 Tax=Rhizophora mucronata TaxID=61149 RepID=A0A2P2QJ86_RHIMU